MAGGPFLTEKSMSPDATARDADALRARLLAALGWEGVDPSASLIALGLVPVATARDLDGIYTAELLRD